MESANNVSSTALRRSQQQTIVTDTETTDESGFLATVGRSIGTPSNTATPPAAPLNGRVSRNCPLFSFLSKVVAFILQFLGYAHPEVAVAPAGAATSSVSQPALLSTQQVGDLLTRNGKELADLKKEQTGSPNASQAAQTIRTNIDTLLSAENLGEGFYDKELLHCLKAEGLLIENFGQELADAKQATTSDNIIPLLSLFTRINQNLAAIEKIRDNTPHEDLKTFYTDRINELKLMKNSVETALKGHFTGYKSALPTNSSKARIEEDLNQLLATLGITADAPTVVRKVHLVEKHIEKKSAELADKLKNNQTEFKKLEEMELEIEQKVQAEKANIELAVLRQAVGDAKQTDSKQTLLPRSNDTQGYHDAIMEKLGTIGKELSEHPASSKNLLESTVHVFLSYTLADIQRKLDQLSSDPETRLDELETIKSDLKDFKGKINEQSAVIKNIPLELWIYETLKGTRKPGTILDPSPSFDMEKLNAIYNDLNIEPSHESVEERALRKKKLETLAPLLAQVWLHEKIVHGELTSRRLSVKNKIDPEKIAAIKLKEQLLAPREDYLEAPATALLRKAKLEALGSLDLNAEKRTFSNLLKKVLNVQAGLLEPIESIYARLENVSQILDVQGKIDGGVENYRSGFDQERLDLKTALEQSLQEITGEIEGLATLETTLDRTTAEFDAEIDMNAISQFAREYAAHRTLKEIATDGELYTGFNQQVKDDIYGELESLNYLPLHLSSVNGSDGITVKKKIQTLIGKIVDETASLATESLKAG